MPSQSQAISNSNTCQMNKENNQDMSAVEADPQEATRSQTFTSTDSSSLSSTNMLQEETRENTSPMATSPRTDGSSLTPSHTSNSDNRARMMAAFMTGGTRASITIGSSLMNQASRKLSIKKLSMHVPTCVLKKLTKDMLESQNMEQGEEKHEAGSQCDDNVEVYQGALLFVDMSGFTKLSQALEVEELSKTINEYFEAIVGEIIRHGGDVLKFAGDAIFAEWRVEAIPEKKKVLKEGNGIRKVVKRGMGSSTRRVDSSRGASGATASSRNRSTTRNSIRPETKIRQRTESKKSRSSVAPSTNATRGLYGKKDSTGSSLSNSARSTSRHSPSSSIASDLSNTSQTAMNMEDCVHAAACCGAAIVNKCADYPVYEASGLRHSIGAQGALIATLNVHCGIGAGEMAGVHVGDDVLRREYLIIGEPIDQVAEACDTAQLGEIRISGEALKYLNKGQSYKNQLELQKGEKSKLIASRKTMYFNKKRKSVWSLDGRIRKPLTPKPLKFEIPFDDVKPATLKHFHHLLSSYVHPVIKAEDLPTDMLAASQRSLLVNDDTITADSELRTVFTLFVMPKMEAKLSSDPEKNRELFKKLNEIMSVVNSILESYKGHLRQYIVDDKGIVLIGTFGLRGATFTNMVAERALPTCRVIHGLLQDELDVECQVGGTLGKVYCGVVGGVKRHEYAVLGPSVNLAARLMANKQNPGVLVDDAVRRKAKGTNFITFPPVKAKGYSDLVPVFKPLTAKEARWGRVNPKFVGRRKETKMICNLAMSVTKKHAKSNVVFVWGESGSGKSAFVVHAIHEARKLLIAKQKIVIITRNATSEGDALVPFSLLRHIFRDILSEAPTNMSDDASYQSYGNYSKGSMSTFDIQSTGVLQRLMEICDEMGAPRGFLEIVGQHLLGDNKGKVTKLEKAPEMDEIIEFMAKVFIRSTDHAEGVILALDDVQWMDSLSWKVVQRILETSTNVVMVCGSRPKESHPLSMSDEFWGKLTGEYAEKKLFREITIAELNEDDIREMSALSFGCDPDEVDDSFCEDVFSHSGGMPFFTSEILGNCMKEKRCSTLTNGKVGWTDQQNRKEALQFANVEELFLVKVDSLSDLSRRCVQFGAVCGLSFMQSEAIDMSVRALKIIEDDVEDHSQLVRFALREAVDANILYECHKDEDTIVGDSSSGSFVDIAGSDEHENDNADFAFGDTEYSFVHDTWRRVITSSLLNSYIRELHKYAAKGLEEISGRQQFTPFRTQCKIFSHWRDADNTVNASRMALEVGQSFKMLGMIPQGIEIYTETINMWKKYDPPEGTERIAGFSPEVLESLDLENITGLVKVQTALGQAIGSIYKGDLSKSAQAFRDALEILRVSPTSTEIVDRAFIFPIYSGMFFLLKYGALCAPEETVQTELDLVEKFVLETNKHGDPVHHGRALAMQGETCHRLSKFEEAVQSNLKLKDVYDIDRDSEKVVASYASDRCAQNFGCTANCYMRLGQVDKALELCDYIEYEMMPKMNPKNIHNSAVMTFPIIWILKDNGQVDRAKDVLHKFVQDPFDIHIGKDGSTPFLPAFKPYKICLEVASYMEGNLESFDDTYYDWALDIKNLKLNPKTDIGIGNFGRSVMSASAETCLRLSKLVPQEEIEKRKTYIRNGLEISKIALSTCDGSSDGMKMHTPYAQVKPVYDELQKLAEELGV